MSTSALEVEGRTRGRWGYVVTTALVLVFFWAAFAVTGIFRLSSDTAALQNAVLRDIDGAWHKKIALSAGFLTTGLIRMGSSVFRLEAEPRAAIQSVRGAEVAVYTLEGDSRSVDHQRVLQDADAAMSARGWERVAGISEDNKLVAIFSPRHASGTRLKMCVLVLDGTNLVIAGGKAELKPLFDLAMKRVESQFAATGQEQTDDYRRPVKRVSLVARDQ